MSRRISLLLGLALTMFANVGCCAWADRWCGHHNPPVAAAPQYCVPAPQQCYPAPPPPVCYPAPPPQGYQR